MKLKFFCFAMLVLFWNGKATATNLIEVYQRAQMVDPTFQKAIADRLATQEGVPISIAAILPNLSFSMNPSLSRSEYSGTSFINAFTNPRNNTQRAYTMNLSLTQTVFNFAQYSTIAQQVAISKKADATLNAALQDLMIRVSTAYFNILRDIDALHYSEQSEHVYANQLDLVKRQYNVHVATITDVYTAKASYNTAVANRIQAQIILINDRENLRKITGINYPYLAKLKKDAPLLRPNPANEEAWVRGTLAQNWSIKAAQFNVDSEWQNVNVQRAGNLPTINVQGTLSRQYTNNLNSYNAANFPQGPGLIAEKQVMVNINMPLFEGGGVQAKTKQAVYNFEAAKQQLDGVINDTVAVTRQSYNSVMLGVSEIKSDLEAIASNIRSVHGMEISHHLGIETLVNLLNQQQLLFQSQLQYVTHRYAYINNYLILKQATGVLSYQDLFALNTLLTN